jgi:hypothetical protein
MISHHLRSGVNATMAGIQYGDRWCSSHVTMRGRVLGRVAIFNGLIIELVSFFTHLLDKRAFKGSTISKYLVQKRAARALHFQNTLEQWRLCAAAAVVIPVYPHLLLFFAFYLMYDYKRYVYSI